MWVIRLVTWNVEKDIPDYHWATEKVCLRTAKGMCVTDVERVLLMWVHCVNNLLVLCCWFDKIFISGTGVMYLYDLFKLFSQVPKQKIFRQNPWSLNIMLYTKFNAWSFGLLMIWTWWATQWYLVYRLVYSPTKINHQIALILVSINVNYYTVIFA